MLRAASASANSRQHGAWDLGFALRRRNRKIDDLLTLQLAHQARDFVLAERTVAELQPEQAALGAIDDRGLVIVEQRIDVGHPRLRRKSHQRARRRVTAEIAG